jgi:hypothetical protein
VRVNSHEKFDARWALHVARIAAFAGEINTGEPAAIIM